MKKKILVAPLNWGLGHATRCIPIINFLLQHHFTPILASDGEVLALLKKEFPKLETLRLPSYNITYPKNGHWLKSKMLWDAPKIMNAIKAEQQMVNTYIRNNRLSGIISDNRYGVLHKRVPSVILTHQLHVLSGATTWLSSQIQQKLIARFNSCWVPDIEEEPNLSGDMGHGNFRHLNIKYIGPLSRFEKQSLPLKYEVLIVLSGPEPQRTLLENKLMVEFEGSSQNVLMVRGVIETKQSVSQSGHLTIYNFMTSAELGQAMNESRLVIARSGYSTIMDLARLSKKAFFIPTPGQFEQIYLAEKMQKEGIAPFCVQKEFSLQKLQETHQYKGFTAIEENLLSCGKLFDLFQSK